MNMLYEGLKEKGALMLIPSSAVESMGVGGLLGAAAMRQQAFSEDRAASETRQSAGGLSSLSRRANHSLRGLRFSPFRVSRPSRHNGAALGVVTVVVSGPRRVHPESVPLVSSRTGVLDDVLTVLPKTRRLATLAVLLGSLGMAWAAMAAGPAQRDSRRVGPAERDGRLPRPTCWR